jgi:hypothetical protein
MPLRRLLLLGCAICVWPLIADQITLKNGDRVTGSVVKKDGKMLTVKTDHFGTVEVAWEAVQSVVSDEPVTVELPDGRTLLGIIATSQDKVEINAGAERHEVPISDVVALRDAKEQRTWERLRRPGWTDLWAGTVSFGFAGTAGNAKTTTLTTGLNAARVTRADKSMVYFNAIKAAALVDGVSATTAQAVRGGWGYSRNTGERFFVNVFNDYEFDRFQNLDLRFVLGGGAGYHLWKGERGRVDVLGGLAYNRESFGVSEQAEGFTRDSAEVYFGDELTYALNSATSLFQNWRVFPNVSEGGDYRSNFDAGATTRLTRWLTWNLAISNRLLSNPVPGRKRNDFLYTTGIGVNFAR